MGRPKHKLSKGQPKGARSASGRKRDRAVIHVLPCEGVMRRRDLYCVAATQVGEAGADERTKRRGRQETDTCDALGRAYCVGLLGTGEMAERRLTAGRKIAAQYWRVYGFPTPDSLARFQPQPPSLPVDPKTERIREDALGTALDMVRARGRDVRKFFDQLVIDLNPDSGPPWLDAMVVAHRQRIAPASRDMTLLTLALEGLDTIA